MLTKFQWAKERQFALRLAAIIAVVWVAYAGAVSSSRIPHYYNSPHDSEAIMERAAYLDCFKEAGADIIINPSPIISAGPLGLPQTDCPAHGVKVGLSNCLDMVKLEAVKMQRPDLEKQCAAARQVVEDRFDADYRYERQYQQRRIAKAIARDFFLIPIGILIFFSFIAHPVTAWLIRGLRNDLKAP